MVGTKHILITNHNQERGAQVVASPVMSDVPAASSETLFLKAATLCSEVLKCIFFSVAMVLYLAIHRFIPIVGMFTLFLEYDLVGEPRR